MFAMKSNIQDRKSAVFSFTAAAAAVAAPGGPYHIQSKFIIFGV